MKIVKVVFGEDKKNRPIGICRECESRKIRKYKTIVHGQEVDAFQIVGCSDMADSKFESGWSRGIPSGQRKCPVLKMM